jgi:hypothetical protein
MEEITRSESPATASDAGSPTPASAAPASPTPADAPSSPLTPDEAPPAPKPRKSTGPRTAHGKRHSSQNALKHGRDAEGGRSYVESVWHSMVDLGEDPKEFARLLGDLIESHRPATPAEMMLVDDIASLRWQRRRNERAQAALLVRNLEKMEAERSRRALQVEHRMSSDALRGEVLEKGLLHAEDSPSKFAELLRWLEMLDGLAKERQFGEAGPGLEALYGKDPTLRGAYIQGMFKDLAQADPSSVTRSDAYQLLRLTLAEEARDVTEAYRLYWSEHVQVTRAMREECLAPVDARNWRFLLRQELGLDRQIERKTRLVLFMQKASREAAEPQWKEMKELQELASPPSEKR